MQFIDKNHAIKQKLLASLRNKPEQTIQDLCNSIGNDDDLKISEIVTSLALQKKIKSTEYTFLKKEDGGTALVLKYISL